MDDTEQEDRDWAGVKQNPVPKLPELQAKAPVKRKKGRPFTKLYNDEAKTAFTALNCKKAIVWLWLVHRAWKRQSRTVSVPNGELAKLGVHRFAKREALQQLEAVGLISVDRRPRKTPIATLL
jgi:hypothetical protein